MLRLLVLASALAAPAAATGPAGDQACRILHGTGGCLGTFTPSDSPSGGRREPECDDDCRAEASRRNAEWEAYLLSRMPPIYPVESFDPVAYRESKTIKTVAADDNVKHASLSSDVLVLGTALGRRWFPIAVVLVVLPHLHLERYTPAITHRWEAWSDVLPEVLEAPGDCSQNQYDGYKHEVRRHCKEKPHACKKGERDCAVLNDSIEKFDNCIRARSNMNNACFRGRDHDWEPGDEKAPLAQEIRGLQNCIKIKAKANCP